SVNIIDRDFVEPSNLQRQTLFDESDARNALPKAVAAEHKLRSINSGVEVRGVVADLGPKNAVELLSGCDLILDGTDNFETRFLINDFAVESGRVWIYAAAVASYGLTLTIRPGVTPCLACLLESGNSSQALEETCDTIGVLGPIVNLVASWQVAEALKILAGRPEALHGRLLSGDVWTGRCKRSAWPAIRNAGPAQSTITPISKERRSRISPFAGVIRCRSTSAAGLWTSRPSPAGSRRWSRMFDKTIFSFAFASRLTK